MDVALAAADHSSVRTDRRAALDSATKSGRGIMSEISTIPSGHTTVTPHLIIKGASEAIAFYAKAFGATEIARMAMPGGKIGHAEIQVGSSRLYLAEESPEYGCLSARDPGRLPDRPPSLRRGYRRGFRKGRRGRRDRHDAADGYVLGRPVRQAHRPLRPLVWSMAQRIEELSFEEMQRRGVEAMAGTGCQEAAERHAANLAATA